MGRARTVAGWEEQCVSSLSLTSFQSIRTIPGKPSTVIAALQHPADGSVFAGPGSGASYASFDGAGECGCRRFERCQGKLESALPRFVPLTAADKITTIRMSIHPARPNARIKLLILKGQNRFASSDLKLFGTGPDAVF
jgi:hypothetical protein